MEYNVRFHLEGKGNPDKIGMPYMEAGDIIHVVLKNGKTIDCEVKGFFKYGDQFYYELNGFGLIGAHELERLK